MNTLSFTDVKIKLVDEPETASQNRTELKSDPASPLRDFERLDVKINLVDEPETTRQNNQLNADPDSPFETLEHMKSDSFFKYFLNSH